MKISMFMFCLVSAIAVTQCRPSGGRDLLLRELMAELTLVDNEISRRRSDCPDCYPTWINEKEDSLPDFKKRTNYGQSDDFYRYLGMGKRSTGPDVTDDTDDTDYQFPVLQYRSVRGVPMTTDEDY